MSDLMVFEKEEFGKVRSKIINGDPWFVAKDVCACLGLTNSREALSSLDDDEKGVSITDTLGGPQEIVIISEAGLYTLILRMRRRKGDPARSERIANFRRWVTHEVIPSIRKTGQYSARAPQRTLEDIATVFKYAGLEGHQLALALDNVYREETSRSLLAGVNLVAPVQEALLTPTQIAAELGYGYTAKRVNKILEKMGLQRRRGDKWEPVRRDDPYAVLLDTGKWHGGAPVTQLKWRSGIVNRVKEFIIL